MADPVEFSGMSGVVGPPPGLEGIIGSLPALRDGKHVVTCWKLSAEELDIVRRTGEVWVSIQSGVVVFPMLVTAVPLTDQAYEELHKRLADVVRIATG